MFSMRGFQDLETLVPKRELSRGFDLPSVEISVTANQSVQALWK